MAAGAVSGHEWKAFFIHVVLYIVVNLGLVQINLMSEPEKIWFVWPMIGWGIGVAAHGLALYLQARASGHGLLAQPEARGFIAHLFVYVAVNLLLAFINLSQTPTTLWFQWPLLFWGAAVFIHGLVMRRAEASQAADASKAARAKPQRAKAGAGSRRRSSKKG